LNGICLTVHP